METNALMEKFQDDLNWKKKGGFRRIDTPVDNKGECTSIEHNPPSHMYLEGGTYEYTCPQCGNTVTIIVPKISW